MVAGEDLSSRVEASSGIAFLDVQLAIVATTIAGRSILGVI